MYNDATFVPIILIYINMSTRWYPIYQKGGPQLRVYLPNFWLKLVKPVHEQPPNVVQFACSMEMTKHDVKNYLEKIYKVNVVSIHTRIALGKTKRDPGKGYIIKEDDVKYAYVILPKTESFVFPDIFPKDKKEKDKDDNEKVLDETRSNYDKFLNRNKSTPGTPGWFTV